MGHDEPTYRDYAVWARQSLEDIARDCHVQAFRASGPGGQCVNTTDSAVRMTHVPSGMTVTSHESRSQFRNRQLCLQKLCDRFVRDPRLQGAPSRPEAPALPNEGAARPRRRVTQAISQCVPSVVGRPPAEPGCRSVSCQIFYFGVRRRRDSDWSSGREAARAGGVTLACPSFYERATVRRPRAAQAYRGRVTTVHAARQRRRMSDKEHAWRICKARRIVSPCETDTAFPAWGSARGRCPMGKWGSMPFIRLFMTGIAISTRRQPTTTRAR